jgi:hypothetical protein
VPQYRNGLVILSAGSQTVTAAWRAFITGALKDFHPEAPVKFLTSGASGVILLHQLAQGVLAWELDGGSPDPNANEGAKGATTENVYGGTAAAGSTVSSLQDDGASFSADEHNDRWVNLRPGGPNEEWREILDTLVTPSRLVPVNDFTVTPGAGDAYGIYETQQVTLAGFGAGTPQDFVSNGVGANDTFVSEGVVRVVDTVAARSLTLTAAYPTTQRGVPFGVTQDHTSRGYPIVQKDDRNPNAIVGEATKRINNDIDPLYTRVWNNVIDNTAGYLGNWSDGTPKLEWAKDHLGWVVFKGRVLKPGAAVPGNPAFVLLDTPINFRPSYEIVFSFVNDTGSGYDWVILKFATNGTISFEAGAAGEYDLTGFRFPAVGAV